MRLPAIRAVVVAALCSLGPIWGQAVEIDPIGRGPHPVATTNFEVREPAAGEKIVDYLNGHANSKRTRYITDLLAQPEAALTLTVPIPANRGRYGPLAGARVPLALYVVYPTTSDNPRPHYEFPYAETGDRSFTHMQRRGEKPLFADATARYPLILYTGGYNTHGLWHLEHLKLLASHGYIVVDLFHGDNRGPSFLFNLAARPLHVRATLDHLLQHPDFAPAIDPARIGISGASAGGSTIMQLLGGVNPGNPSSEAADPRIKVGVGVVPFLGGEVGMWPFKIDAWLFGRDHAGLRKVRAPFLAVYGEMDESIEPRGVEAAVNALAGPATAILLAGETHMLSGPAHVDAYTWELVFFDAWLRDNPDSRRKLTSATSVKGTAMDRRTVSREGVRD